jgi:TatD DNase family protein
MISLTDTHAHLDDDAFASDCAEVIERAREAGIERIINIGADMPGSRASLALARRHAFIWAVVGCHPHVAGAVTERDYAELTELLSDPRVVAVGEIGLDYYRSRTSVELQKELFRRQIRLAREVGKPMVIHDRDAHEDTLAILREERADEIGGVLHCFSGDAELARRSLDLGFYIGFDGPLTFSNGQRARAAALAVPSDRLLLETDCPYLTPEPHRGQRNEPAYLVHTAQQLAQLKGMSLAELAAETNANANRLFGLS